MRDRGFPSLFATYEIAEPNELSKTTQLLEPEEQKRFGYRNEGLAQGG